MRTIFLVLLAALITLPIFGDEKKPTPPPAAKKQGDVKPTTAPPAKAIKGSKSNSSENAVGDAGAGSARVLTQQGRVDNPQITGKVISKSRNTFTVMSNGKQITFSGAKLKALPKVGDIIDISYTQSSGGPLEATTVKSSKSNSSE